MNGHNQNQGNRQNQRQNVQLRIGRVERVLRQIERELENRGQALAIARILLNQQQPVYTYHLVEADMSSATASGQQIPGVDN